MSYIITEYDVIKRTTLSSSTSPNVICNFISCEIDALEECFGDHYEKLIADLAPTEGIKQYCQGEEYQEGTKVMFMGKAFIRTSSDGDGGDDSPFCSDMWKVCDKFKSGCYNLIYDCICDYLAWFIFGEAAPFLQIQSSDAGFIFPSSDQNGGTGAEKDWYYLMVRKIKSTCAKKLNRLKKKIEGICRRGECEVFLTIPFMQDCGTECNPEDKVSSHTAFKDKGRRRR